ncbi:hypothetical protein LCGC14_2624400 [marine sediment metagenome]|uniref:Uncharacterized protein n=1 Tax=marine sediment metagenome TaxID=412755 RepID=A0A0F9A229_9ZZZZ
MRKDPFEENDEMHFINEPFLTEEGFVNEACMNELGEAIRNMPKTYERLSHNLEWSEKRWTFRKEITRSFAKWATSQSSYPCPEGLEKIIDYLDICLKKEVDWGEDEMAKLSLCEINKLLYDILYEQGLSVFDDWNVPKKEWRDTVFMCIGEAERANPDYGYISLDALLHNVCLDIRTERRENDRFDAKFKEKYGELK